MPHVRVGDIQMWYEERGQGPALVFIAGLGGRPRQFEGLIDLFQDRYRCITFDNRGGVGQTDKPPGPYSIAQFADDTAGLLAALDAAPAHIVGFSMGGMIAQDLGLRYPERCRCLILEGTAAGSDPWVEHFIRLWVTARRSLPTEDFQWLLHLFNWHPRNVVARHAQLAEEARAPWPQSQPLEALGWQAEALLSFDSRARLAELRVPTLILVGDTDLQLPLHCSEELHRLIPGSELVVIPQAGHAVRREWPDRWVAAAAPFLARHD